MLIQKARTVKDTAMVRYQALANFDEASRGEGADDEARKKKADAYLEWLQSIVFFEICVREYDKEVGRMMQCIDEEASQKTSEYKDLKNRIETMDKVFLTSDSGKIQKWEQETQQLLFTWLNRVNKLYYELFFLTYCVELIQDFFASLRVLVLIEYVNVNTTIRKGTDDERITLRDSEYRIAYEEALFWERTVDRWLQSENGVKFAHNCFAMMDKWNRNHTDYYKMLNRMARRICPLNNTQTGRLESQVYFHDALKEYISIMENRYMDCIHGNKISSEQREKVQEDMDRENERLKEIWVQLAMPICREMNRGNL